MPDLTDTELDELDQHVMVWRGLNISIPAYPGAESIVALLHAAPRLLAEIRTLRDLNAWLVKRDEEREVELMEAIRKRDEEATAAITNAIDRESYRNRMEHAEAECACLRARVAELEGRHGGTS